MKTLALQVPDRLPDFLPQEDTACAKEILLSAVVRWFEQGLVSQGWSAQFLGMSRAEFLDELYRLQVSPSQTTAKEILEEVDRAIAHRQ